MPGGRFAPNSQEEDVQKTMNATVEASTARRGAGRAPDRAENDDERDEDERLDPVCPDRSFGRPIETGKLFVQPKTNCSAPATTIRRNASTRTDVLAT